MKISTKSSGFRIIALVAFILLGVFLFISGFKEELIVAFQWLILLVALFALFAAQFFVGGIGKPMSQFLQCLLFRTLGLLAALGLLPVIAPAISKSWSLLIITGLLGLWFLILVCDAKRVFSKAGSSIETCDSCRR